MIDVSLRAAKAIGNGLYGVDVKEFRRHAGGDRSQRQPQPRHGVEDQVGKDEVWSRILQWFVKRIEA